MSKWTEASVRQLCELWPDASLSAAEIGRRMGMSKNMVVGKAHRLELPGRESPIKRSSTPRVPQPHRLKPTATLAPLSSMVTPLPAVGALAPLPPPKPIAIRTERCAFPLSDGRPWRFCEAIAEYGSPYCTKHHRICYVRHEWSAAA